MSTPAEKLKTALKILESYDGKNGKQVITDALEIIVELRKEAERK